PEIYTSSLHDALPIWRERLDAQEREEHCGAHDDGRYDGDDELDDDGEAEKHLGVMPQCGERLPQQSAEGKWMQRDEPRFHRGSRSEEHTSELQSRENL